MINYVYQLVSPKLISVKHEVLDTKDMVLIRPEYMSICQADQRYYQGMRSGKVMKEKLPMALIHECCGTVVYDDTNTFKEGQRVVMIPNHSSTKNDVIYENYAKDSFFLSSGHDGFMRELVNLLPDRVVQFENIELPIAAITEFVSVGVHAITRFDLAAHSNRGIIGIWGDGSLAYIVASLLKELQTESEIIVVGKNINKLSHFSFVDKTYLADYLPSDFEVDHAFECVGGEGSYFAIDDIIRYINPQGTVMLLGVSENKVPIYTRDILEKGLSFIGCSRSGRTDFQKAVELLGNKKLQNRLSTIIFEDKPVSSITDIHRVFQADLSIPFKTVFRWNL